MKVIFDNKLDIEKNKFKDIRTGECFDFNGNLYFKGVFSTTRKPKAVNIITGEIIDLDGFVTVIPITAEFHYNR